VSAVITEISTEESAFFPSSISTFFVQQGKPVLKSSFSQEEEFPNSFKPAFAQHDFESPSNILP
jgi:hypothetical protein